MYLNQTFGVDGHWAWDKTDFGHPAQGKGPPTGSQFLTHVASHLFDLEQQIWHGYKTNGQEDFGGWPHP